MVGFTPLDAIEGVIPEAQTSLAPRKEVKQEEKAAQLERDLNKLADVSAEIRVHSRQAQIDALKADGAQPFKVFAGIAGEWSRADNIFCGINGEADHQVTSSYLREVARSANGDMRDVLSWLAAQGDNLAAQRRIVKTFLLLDQQTDPVNYQDGRTVNEDTTFFNSSLGDIDTRVLPEYTQTKLVGRLAETSGDIAAWKDDREKYSALGKELLPFIVPRNPNAALPIIENGASDENTGRQWRQAIDSPDWVQTTSQALVEGESEMKRVGETMSDFMGKLTGAEAVLESQYYHVGVGLLRAAASGTLPESCRTIVQADLSKVGGIGGI